MDVVRYLMTRFEDHRCKLDVLDHGKNRGSLVLTIPGERSGKSLAFVGHVDTVPVDDAEQWGFAPHGALIEDGFLYGRGAADMKGGVTAMVQAALHLLEGGITPQHTLKVCFTADEEADGLGAVAIEEAGFLDDAAAIFIPEPTEGKIGLMEKGALWLEVTAIGRSSHGARPDLGTNAIEHLLAYLERLRGAIDLSRESDVLSELNHSTFVVTKIDAGTKTNVVPARAQAAIDVRTVFGVDHQNIIHTAQAIAAEMAASTEDLSLTVAVENDRPAIGIAREHVFIAGIAAEMERLGLPLGYKGLHFYTDGSQVVPRLDVPFVILGPGEDGMAHQRDERIALEAVSDVANVFISYILNLDEKEEVFK
jgi:succinyl-diaminopimelate desuccinylase